MRGSLIKVEELIRRRLPLVHKLSQTETGEPVDLRVQCLRRKHPKHNEQHSQRHKRVRPVVGQQRTLSQRFQRQLCFPTPNGRTPNQ
jgi:hypothetical protein